MACLSFSFQAILAYRADAGHAHDLAAHVNFDGALPEVTAHIQDVAVADSEDFSRTGRGGDSDTDRVLEQVTVGLDTATLGNAPVADEFAESSEAVSGEGGFDFCCTVEAFGVAHKVVGDGVASCGHAEYEREYFLAAACGGDSVLEVDALNECVAAADGEFFQP